MTRKASPKLAAMTLAAAILMGALGAPSMASAETGCPTATVTDLTRTVTATTATQNPVRSEPSRNGTGLGLLTAGAKYQAGASITCNDGFTEFWTPLLYNGAVSWTASSTIATYTPPADLVFDRKIQSAGLLGATMHSAPAATAAELGQLAKGTVYPAANAVTGPASLSGTDQWIPVRIASSNADSSVAYVNSSSVATAVEGGSTTLGEKDLKALTELIVTERGDGAAVYSVPNSTTIDYSALTQALAGRGEKLGTLKVGDIYFGRAELYEGVSISALGAIGTALAEDAAKDPELKASMGKWRLITFNDQPAFVDATSFSEKRGLISSAKAHAAVAAKAVKAAAVKAKDKIASKVANHKTKPSTPTLLGWIKLLPAGALALLALILAAFSLRRARGVLGLHGVKPFVRPVIASTAIAAAAVAAYLIPATAPLFATPVSLALSLVTATAALLSSGTLRGAFATTKSRLTRGLVVSAVAAVGVGALTLHAGWLPFAASAMGAIGLVVGLRGRSTTKTAALDSKPSEEPASVSIDQEVASNGGW